MNIGELTASLGIDLNEQQKNLNAAQAKLREFTNQSGKALGQVENQWSLASQAVGVYRTALVAVGAVVGATAGLTTYIKLVANIGGEFHDMSQRTGIAVEALSAYKLSAELAGTSLQGLTIGIRGLSRGLLEASQGTGDAKEAFDALGISVKDSQGVVKTTDAIILEVADSFFKMENGALKNSLSMRIFGRAGMELVPMLNEGAKGLLRQREEAKALGLIWSSISAKDADAFNDALTTLKLSTIGLISEMVVGLLPVYTEWIRQITEAIKWLREMGGILDSVGKKWSDWLVGPGFKATKGTVPTGMPPGFGETGQNAKDQKQALADASAEIQKRLELAGKINKMKEEGTKLTESMRTSQETYNATLQKYNELLSVGVISQETYNRAMQQARTTYAETLPHIRLIGKAYDEISNTLDSAVNGVIQGTQTISDAFRNMAQNILLSLQKMLVQELILAPLKGILMGGLTGQATGGGFFASLKFPKFASGGSITGPSIVGERGPELFIPNAPGNIVSNDRLGGISIVQNFNIGSGQDADSVRRVLISMRPQLKKDAVEGVEEAIGKGGSLARRVGAKA